MRVLSFDVGLRNLAWCDLQYSPESFQIQSWHVESAVEESTNVNETSIESLVPSFVKLIHEHFDTVDTLPSLQDQILIESQPMGHGRSFGGTSFGGSPRNLKTKVLSHIIQAQFLQQKQSPSQIHFISPTLKLKDCPIPYKERTQKANKKYAIEKTAELIQNQYQDLFVGAKRDDLADAFLQGYMVALCVTNGSMKLDAAKISQKKVKVKKEKATKPSKEKKVSTKKKSTKSSNELQEHPLDPAAEIVLEPTTKKRRVTKKQRTEAIAADFV